MINVEAHAVHCRMVNSIILWWMNYLVKGTIPLCLKQSTFLSFDLVAVQKSANVRQLYCD